MLKIIFLPVIFVFLVNIASAQKSFNITIKLDSSINPQNMRYQYYDGKTTIILPDTFGNKREVVLKDNYCSPLASFHVNYQDAAKATYDNDFFISQKPAEVILYCKPNKGE